MSTVATITAQNEANTIGELVRVLKEQGMIVIVADANSTDTTAPEADAAGAIVLAEGGIAPNIRDNLLMAYRKALDLGAGAILQIDAGGSHDPAQAPQLLTQLVDADYVVGSRFMDGGAYLATGFTRPMLSRLATAMCNRVTGRDFSDWTSGYRAMTADVAEHLLNQSYHATMHGWQIETLASVLRAGYKVAEAPISYRAGRSAFDTRIAIEAVGVWARLAA